MAIRIQFRSAEVRSLIENCYSEPEHRLSLQDRLNFDLMRSILKPNQILTPQIWDTPSELLDLSKVPVALELLFMEDGDVVLSCNTARDIYYVYPVDEVERKTVLQIMRGNNLPITIPISVIEPALSEEWVSIQLFQNCLMVIDPKGSNYIVQSAAPELERLAAEKGYRLTYDLFEGDRIFLLYEGDCLKLESFWLKDIYYRLYQIPTVAVEAQPLTLATVANYLRLDEIEPESVQDWERSLTACLKLSAIMEGFNHLIGDYQRQLLACIQQQKIPGLDQGGILKIHCGELTYGVSGLQLKPSDALRADILLGMQRLVADFVL